MADVNRGNRPLSPHLSVYRPQITMVTSITHRITGIGLAVSAVLIVWWFLAASTGPEYFAVADAVLTRWSPILGRRDGVGNGYCNQKRIRGFRWIDRANDPDADRNIGGEYELSYR